MEKTPRLNFNGVTALLVEGDRHSVSLLSEILRRFGLDNQYCVETGAEAKAHMQRITVDFFFCEAVLPDMDGLDLVRWVRRSAPVPYIPVVVLTGYSRVDAVVGARDAGQMTGNLERYAASIPPELWAELHAASLLPAMPPLHA